MMLFCVLLSLTALSSAGADVWAMVRRTVPNQECPLTLQNDAVLCVIVTHCPPVCRRRRVGHGPADRPQPGVPPDLTK